MLAFSMVLLGCNQPQTPPTPAAVDAVPSATTAPLLPGRVKVVGQVKVPVNVLLGSGVQLISDHALGLVSNNAAGNFRILNAMSSKRLTSLGGQSVQGVRVFLADASGRPIPDIPDAITDENASFELLQVPADDTFVIVAEVPTAEGKSAQLRTVARVGKYGATTSLDAASTLVSFNVLEGLPGGALGNFNPTKFESAVQATERNLRPDNLPDFTDILAIKSRMNELAQAVAELRDLLGAIRSELAELRSAVESLKPESPAPSAVPAPAATPAPAVPDKVVPPPQNTPSAPPSSLVSVPSPPPPQKEAEQTPEPLPEKTPAPVPSAVPSTPPSAATNIPTGCSGTSNRRCQIPPGFPFTTVGVRPLGQATIFSQNSVNGGYVQLEIPEGCPIEFVAQDPLGGWMPFFGSLQGIQPGSGDLRLY